MPDFIESYEFEDPVETLESLAFVLNRLLQEICDRLVAQSLATNELRLTWSLKCGKFRRGKTENSTSMIGSCRFPRKTRTCSLLFCGLIWNETLFPRRSRKLTLEAVPVKPRMAQGNLFAPPSPEAEKLEITLARIRGVVGSIDAEGISCVGSPRSLILISPAAFAVQSLFERFGEHRASARGCSHHRFANFPSRVGDFCRTDRRDATFCPFVEKASPRAGCIRAVVRAPAIGGTKPRLGARGMGCCAERLSKALVTTAFIWIEFESNGLWKASLIR